MSRQKSNVSRKMRILFCTNHFIMGGLEKVLCQYLLALKSLSNTKVSVVSKKKVTEPYFLDFFQKNNIKLTDSFDVLRNKFLFIKMGQDSFINKLLKKIKWLKLKIQNDIFIDFANFSYTQEFKELHKKKIAWCHGSILFYKTYCANQINDIENNVYDKIISLSESFKKDFISLHPELAEKIDFIYNPIDVDKTRALAEEKTLIEVNTPYFIAVQRLDIDKDVVTVINGFNLYSQIDKDTKLYIVGDGPNRKELEQLAHGNANIIFTGQINNPYPLIKNARALILSSTKKIGEGLPNTLLEAQALGTLAISSDVKSGVREILLNGEAGLLFEAENPQSLAEKLVYTKNHPTECQQMVQTATENLDRFDVERAVNNFVVLCDIKKEAA